MVTGLDILLWGNLFISFFAILPCVICLRYFYITRVWDYLILAGFFGATFLSSFLFRFSQESIDFVLLNQIEFIFTFLEILFIFFIAVRVKWEHAPTVLWYAGIIFCSIIFFMILFMEPVVLTDPVQYWFWTVYRQSPVTDSPVSALVTQGGVVLFSADTWILYSVGRIWVYSLLIYVYWTSKQIINYPRITRAKLLWSISALGFVITSILAIINAFDIVDIIPNWEEGILIWGTPTIIGMIIFTFNALLYPEALLLSHVQISRATQIYQRVQEPRPFLQDLGIAQIRTYLESFPPDIIGIIQE